MLIQGSFKSFAIILYVLVWTSEYSNHNAKRIKKSDIYVSMCKCIFYGGHQKSLHIEKVFLSSILIFLY